MGSCSTPMALRKPRICTIGCTGSERLCTVISQHWAGTAQDIQAAVMADVRCHIGAQKVFDDMTLVVAKQR